MGYIKWCNKIMFSVDLASVLCKCFVSPHMWIVELFNIIYYFLIPLYYFLYNLDNWIVQWKFIFSNSTYFVQKKSCSFFNYIICHLFFKVIMYCFINTDTNSKFEIRISLSQGVLLKCSNLTACFPSYCP